MFASVGEALFLFVLPPPLVGELLGCLRPAVLFLLLAFVDREVFDDDDDDDEDEEEEEDDDTEEKTPLLGAFEDADA